MGIEDKVIELIKKNIPIDNQKNITKRKSLIDDLNMSSINIIDLIVDIEGEFDIQLDDLYFESMQTVGSIIDYVEMKVNEKNA